MAVFSVPLHSAHNTSGSTDIYSQPSMVILYRHTLEATAMNMRFLTIFSLLILLTPPTTRADVTLNNLFGDHMVLQQGIANKIWGKADPGENILVSIAKQKHSTIAIEDGNWSIQLDAIVEYGGPHTLTVTANNIIMLQDILVGEVWICSGQSNMQFSVQQADDADLEMVTAQLGQIRLISVPQVGTTRTTMELQRRMGRLLS